MNRYLFVGADTPLIQAFRKASATTAQHTVWIDPAKEEVSSALQRIGPNLTHVWLFDTDFGRHSRCIVRALFAVLAWKPAHLFYMFGPGGNDLSELSVDVGEATIFHCVKKPDYIIDRAGETFISMGLAEHLFRIKEETTLRIPSFWEHNAFPLPAGGWTKPLTAAYLEDLFELPDHFRYTSRQKKPLCFSTADPWTLYDLCRRVMGIGIQLFEGEPPNPVARLVNDVLRAFACGSEGEESVIESAITQEQIAGLLTMRTGEEKKTPERGDVFSRMQCRELCADDGRSIRYFAGGSGDKVILIINALGLTIKFWERALELLEPDHTVVIWETRCCDLFNGGMEQVVTIDEHVNDIFTIIRHEQWESCHLVSWCNGGRIAVAAAARERSLIASLIFLSPVFRGIEGVVSDDTKFEKELDEVFREVTKNQRIAGMFAEYLVRSNSKTEDPATSAGYVLSLPDESFKKEVIAPMRTGLYLVNYARRTDNDEHYPVRSLIGGIDQPVMCILGTDDAVISNRLTAQVSALFTNATLYMVSGASHYIQLQQPLVFAHLLCAFLQNQEYAGGDVRVKKIMHSL